MKTFGLIVAGLVGLVALVFITHMNNVPTLDETVQAQVSQLDNQYKRRSDLIPNLVATVKGYASHEKDVFVGVTEARSNAGKINLDAKTLNDPAMLQTFEKNQAALSSALSRLLVTVEKYPELKANQNFLQLQAQLEGTENRIAVARKDTISAIKSYNLELRTIPGRWVAALLYPDAEVKENFKATETEKQNVKVAF